MKVISLQAPQPPQRQDAWPRQMAASGQGGCQRFVRMRSRGLQISFDPLIPRAEGIAMAFLRALSAAQEV